MVGEDKLDETLEETFPASDAPANTVETGIRIGNPLGPDASDVPNDSADKLFRLTDARPLNSPPPIRYAVMPGPVASMWARPGRSEDARNGCAPLRQQPGTRIHQRDH
jgi:hypothetical protein